MSGSCERVKLQMVKKIIREEKRRTEENLLFVLNNIKYTQKKLPPLNEKMLDLLDNQGMDQYGLGLDFSDELRMEYALSEEETKYSLNDTQNLLSLDRNMYLIEKSHKNVLQLQMQLEFINPVIGTDGIRIRIGHFFLHRCMVTVKDVLRDQKLKNDKVVADNDIMNIIMKWMKDNQIQIVVGKENNPQYNHIFHHAIDSNRITLENIAGGDTSKYYIETKKGIQKIDDTFIVYLRVDEEDIPAGIVLKECQYQVSFLKQQMFYLHDQQQVLIAEDIIYVPFVLADDIFTREKWRKYSLQPEEMSLVPKKVPIHL